MRLLAAFALLIFSVTMLFPAALTAQEAKDTPPRAPIPSQIVAGKRLFISNAGADTPALTRYIIDHTGAPTGLYDQFFAGMKDWGRYELVATPSEADLVFEISLRWKFQASDPDLWLRILDPKTQTLLWMCVETVPAGSGRPASRRNAWNKALAKLISDAKDLVTQARA